MSRKNRTIVRFFLEKYPQGLYLDLMKILVCVKQVIDNSAMFEIDRAGTWIKSSDRHAFRMNRYDEYALEEAVLIKEKLKRS